MEKEERCPSIEISLARENHDQEQKFYEIPKLIRELNERGCAEFLAGKKELAKECLQRAEQLLEILKAEKTGATVNLEILTHFNWAACASSADEALKHLLIAMNTLKTRTIQIPTKKVIKLAARENWTREEKEEESKKWGLRAKLSRCKLLSRMHLQTFSLYFKQKKYRQAATAARNAITHCHNVFTETIFLCKLLKEKEKHKENDLAQPNIVAPTTDEEFFATMNRIHTFNMTELDKSDSADKEQTLERNQMIYKIYYFQDKVQILQKTLKLCEPILRAIMKQISRCEKRENQPATELLAFTGITSSLTQNFSLQQIRQMQNSKEYKIKNRNALGLKPKKENVSFATIHEIPALDPLSYDDLRIPPSAVQELSTECLQEKLILLAMSYFSFSTAQRYLYSEDHIEYHLCQAQFWHEAALELLCCFLPSDCSLSTEAIESYLKTYKKSEKQKENQGVHRERPKSRIQTASQKSLIQKHPRSPSRNALSPQLLTEHSLVNRREKIPSRNNKVYTSLSSTHRFSPPKRASSRRQAVPPILISHKSQKILKIL